MDSLRAYRKQAFGGLGGDCIEIRSVGETVRHGPLEKRGRVVRRGGAGERFAERNRAASPEVVSAEIEIGRLAGRNLQHRRGGAGTEPHAHDRRTGTEVIDQRTGLGAEYARHRAQRTNDLGAPVGRPAMNERRRFDRYLLDPHARHVLCQHGSGRRSRTVCDTGRVDVADSFNISPQPRNTVIRT